MKCENCLKEHDGSYATGRFCSQICARSSATKTDNKKETKISNCLDCHIEIEINKRSPPSRCKECKIIHEKKLNTYHIKKKKPKQQHYCKVCSNKVKTGNFTYCNDCRSNFEKNRSKYERSYNLTCVVCNKDFVWNRKIKTCSPECLRKQLSITRNLAIASGRVTSFGGRCHKIWYDSKIAGRINCDGNWELQFAKWCDLNDIQFNRNKIGFKYFRSDKNREALYFPDFYLKDLDIYVEVKGYETDLDKEKWLQFPFKLVIIKKEHLKDSNKLKAIFSK